MGTESGLRVSTVKYTVKLDPLLPVVKFVEMVTWVCTDCNRSVRSPIYMIQHSSGGLGDSCLRCELKDGDIKSYKCWTCRRPPLEEKLA